MSSVLLYGSKPNRQLHTMQVGSHTIKNNTLPGSTNVNVAFLDGTKTFGKNTLENGYQEYYSGKNKQ